MHGVGSWKRQWGLALGLAGWLVMGLMGCCGHHTERDYGRSVTNNLAAQIVNPEAGQKVNVGVGLPPEAAVNAYDTYNKSFKPTERRPLLRLTTGE